jgi:hypothetical protein
VSIRASSAPAGPRIDAVLPPEPGRTAVVVDDSAVAALDALDDRLLSDLRGQFSAAVGGPRPGMRLLVGGAARSGPDGSPPLAARMADVLGLEVVAPDGPLVVLRRGELFSAGPASAWWQFAPGRSATPVGARFPAPDWQSELPADVGVRSASRLTVTPVPCGIWIRAVGGPAADLGDPAYGVPPAPGRVAVIAGRPGEPRPPVDALADVIAGLPRRLRRSYVLVPYGPEPAREAPIAQRLADGLGADVLATHGLPSYGFDGSLEIPAVDGSGRSTWQPFVSESVYHRGSEPPTRWAWSAPLTDLPEAGPGTFWLADGWVVDVVPSGLQVRPAPVGPEPHVLRRPVDAEHVDLVVTAGESMPGDVPVPVLAAIGRLARSLPPCTRDRLRMLVTEPADLVELVGLAGALALPIRRLTPDGICPVERVEPAAPDRAGPRSESIGRLHASAVPTASGAVASSTPDRFAPAARQVPQAARNHPHETPMTAAPADHAVPAPHPSGPGRLPAPLPTAAPSPAPAGAAPPSLPPRAEQPPPALLGHGSPPDAGHAPVVPAASPAAPELVLLTPDRVAGLDHWWTQGSGVPDRRQVRQSLGWRYNAASRFVTSLLAERPGLRAAAAGDETLAVDLAAVHTFVAADHAERMESMQIGSPDPATRAFLSCVVSGLRRLPTFTGVVVRGGPDDRSALDAYVGGDVVEPGLLLAVCDPHAEMPGATEVLIWSSTARRLDGLIDGGGDAQVVFLPGTVFRLLDVDRTSSPCLVLLAEVPEQWRDQWNSERDERIRGRLRAAAQSRAATRGEDAGDNSPVDAAAPAHGSAGLVALPGLVPAGAPRAAA